MFYIIFIIILVIMIFMINKTNDQLACNKLKLNNNKCKIILNKKKIKFY